MQGCMVETASCGEEALVKVTQYNFGLVLLDVMMPGIGGKETSIRMRQIVSPTLPIIGVTADHYVTRSAEPHGFDRILTKPLPIEVIADLIHEISGVRESTQSQPRIAVREELFAEVRKSFGAHSAYEQRLVKEFHTETLPRLKSLSDAAQTHDGQQLKTIAHYLRTSFTLIGSRTLTNHCQKIEEESSLGNWDAMAANCAQLHHHYEGVRLQIESL